MKRILLYFVCLMYACISYAQQPKTDRVLKINGDELTGKVTEINDSDIKFIYQGESLSYTIKKEDILKITFASGRIEFFNKQPLSSEKKDPSADATPAGAGAADDSDHHNKVAVLPFGYVKNSQGMGDEMSFKAQSDTYDLLRKHSAGLTMVDPRTTNAILAKAGINRTNLMNYTMDEICHILGVEYVVDGTITQNQGAAITSTSNNYRTTNGTKNSNSRLSGYSSTSSTLNFQTSVSLAIYNDHNDNIYSENRRALFAQNEGAYDSPLQYLLKRCPLYRK